MRNLIGLIGLVLLVVLLNSSCMGRTYVVADTQAPPDKPPIALLLYF